MNCGKSILILAAALLTAVSCLDSDRHRNKYVYYLDFDFEYANVEYDPVDSTFFPPFFTSQNAPLGFVGNPSEDGNTLLGGFGLCQGVDPVVDPDHDPKTPWHCAAHQKYLDELTFAVYRESDDMPESVIATNLPNEESIIVPSAVLVNNTTEFMRAVLFGNGLSGGPFQEGDWAEVTLTGYLNKVKTGSASLRLADYDVFRDSVVTSWTMLDLDGLGSVDDIKVSFASNREDMIRTVCFDHFLFQCSIEY